ncbi:GH25 family lysozyme [Alloscardovia macacae]|uniref:Glycosyl hydrolase family 25 n=1 Tax=Alloscardovia macacae TaxID=1160091 RepID=A0A261F512_9BIFI|nr:GH25 family lysozyme [Alloscardovia macacae]OZG54133.1 glycosyl hydrolase family 25 [Alloscardovia macacae]
MALNGIDISNWQRGINLAAVPADFVVVKATQGTGYVSPAVREQADDALAAGKLLGFYHYASGGSALAEADYFVNTIRDYVGRALLALDFEMGENAAWSNQPNTWIKTFCDRVSATTGVKPLVYIPASGLSRAQGIGDYGLWVAQYANMKPTGYQAAPWNEGAYACAMRQYASTGQLNGYSGNLDLNKFYGDAAAWGKYANPIGNATPATAPAPAPAAVDIEQLARDVIAGKLGDGNTRRERLGANYDAVQARVNQILGANQHTIHVVARGETLSSIAAKYGTNWQHLAQINGLNNPNLIYAGQRITIK